VSPAKKTNAGGRPRHELTANRERQLRRLKARLEANEEKRRAILAELADAARLAYEEDASLRAIGEVIELPRTSVWRFIQENA
jgi:hypothetical protein